MECNVPIYPQVKVRLVGGDGNAFAILGRVQQTMRKAKLSPDQVKEFVDEATAGDYNHLLQTCMKYVSCDSERHCTRCGNVLDEGDDGSLICGTCDYVEE